MRKYRIKRELLKYYHLPDVQIMEQELEYWYRFFVSSEALEEVPSRIELQTLFDYKANRYYIQKKCNKIFSEQEKDLCEKALNGELLDIESLDDIDFSDWYVNNNTYVAVGNSGITGIKEVLKAYLKQKK